MNGDLNPSASGREFLGKVEQLLAPAYADCFSDETRKTRDLLLIVSALLMLSGLGLIALGPEPLKDISVSVTGDLRWILLPLCAYLLVLHSARVYGEWKLWRLRHQAPMNELSDLVSLILAQSTERTKRMIADFALSTDVSNRLMELSRDPPEVIEAKERLDIVQKEFERQSDLNRRNASELSRRELEDGFYKSYKAFEELRRLSEEITRLREEHDARIATKREELERQWLSVKDVGRNWFAEVTSPQNMDLNNRIAYVRNALEPVVRIRSFRFGLEVVFPTGFAIAAIVIGVIAK